MENLNPKYNIQQLIINASKYVDIHSRRLMKLLEPERLLRVRMVVETDDGIPTPFLGYRGQYATWMGPAKGGIRFHCETDEDVWQWVTNVTSIAFLSVAAKAA